MYMYMYVYVCVCVCVCVRVCVCVLGCRRFHSTYDATPNLLAAPTYIYFSDVKDTFRAKTSRSIKIEDDVRR